MLLLPSICCMPSSLLLLLIRFGVFGCAAFSLNLILSSFKAPKSWDKTNRIKSSREALSIPLIEIRKKNALFSKIDKFISWASFRNDLPNVNGYKVRTRPSHPECLSFSRLNDNNTSTMPVHVFLVPLLLTLSKTIQVFSRKCSHQTKTRELIFRKIELVSMWREYWWTITFQQVSKKDAR